jgi:hypothetical protein
MTCQQAKSLLDDYIDGELSDADAEPIRHHVESCPECRDEYESSLQIKSILANQPFPEPGQQYWTEVMPLIMARTVDSGVEILERVPAEAGTEYQKIRLVRSGVLLAASLALMYTAITLGTSHRAELPAQGSLHHPFFVASSVRGLTGSDNFAIVTPKEQVEMARLTAAMGAPGILGRFTVLPGLLSFE